MRGPLQDSQIFFHIYRQMRDVCMDWMWSEGYKGFMYLTGWNCYFFFCSLFIVSIQEDIVACPETHSVVGKIKSNQAVLLPMDIPLVCISTLASEYFCFQFSFCYTVSHIASIVNTKHAFLWATSSRFALSKSVKGYIVNLVLNKKGF